MPPGRGLTKGGIGMSGQLGGQIRALPFTGFTALPFIIVGLALSTVGFVLRKLSADKAARTEQP